MFNSHYPHLLTCEYIYILKINISKEKNMICPGLIVIFYFLVLKYSGYPPVGSVRKVSSSRQLCLFDNFRVLIPYITCFLLTEVVFYFCSFFWCKSTKWKPGSSYLLYSFFSLLVPHLVYSFSLVCFVVCFFFLKLKESALEAVNF